MLSDNLIIVKTFFVFLFMLLSVTGNLSVLYVVAKNKSLRTVPNYFVCSLSIADLLYAIFGVSSIIITTIHKKWVLGDFLCSFVGTTNVLFCTVSIWTLVAISFNRYIAVSKPLRVKQIFTSRRTILLILTIWVVALALSVLPLFGWSRFIAGDNFCLLDGRKDIGYSMLLVLTNYVFTSVSLVTIYIKIFKTIKKYNTLRRKIASKYITTEFTIKSPASIYKADKRQKRNSMIELKTAYTLELDDMNGSYLNVRAFSISSSGVTSPTCNNAYNVSGSSRSSAYNVPGVSCSNAYTVSTERNTKNSLGVNQDTEPKLHSKQKEFISKETKLNTMLLAVVSAFFLCWTPFLIASILYAFDLSPGNFGFLTLGIVITTMNGVINPVIYAVMSKNYREAFKKSIAVNKTRAW